MYCLLPCSGLSLYCGKAECPGQDSLPASPWEGVGGRGWWRRGLCRKAQVKLQGRTRRQEAGFSRKHCGRSRGERASETRPSWRQFPGSEVITWGQGERMMQALTPRLSWAWETPCYPERDIGLSILLLLLGIITEEKPWGDALGWEGWSRQSKIVKIQCCFVKHLTRRLV